MGVHFQPIGTIFVLQSFDWEVSGFFEFSTPSWGESATTSLQSSLEGSDFNRFNNATTVISCDSRFVGTHRLPTAPSHLHGVARLSSTRMYDCRTRRHDIAVTTGYCPIPHPVQRTPFPRCYPPPCFIHPLGSGSPCRYIRYHRLSYVSLPLLVDNCGAFLGCPALLCIPANMLWLLLSAKWPSVFSLAFPLPSCWI